MILKLQIKYFIHELSSKLWNLFDYSDDTHPLEKHILILSNLHQNKMFPTENKTWIIILLNFASNWPVKDTIVHYVVLHIVAQCQALSDVPTVVDC